MSLITRPQTAIASMTPDAVAKVAAYEQTRLALPQIPIHTLHVLHAGMYSRTITIPQNVELTGALIKIPTLILIAGDCLVSCGDDEPMRIKGLAVLPASAHRKQVFGTYAETTVTMMFATDATTIEQAEAQFTDDTAMLFSRGDAALNTIIITGE